MQLSDGTVDHSRAMWIVIIHANGSVERLDWSPQYGKLNIEYPVAIGLRLMRANVFLFLSDRFCQVVCWLPTARVHGPRSSPMECCQK